MALRPRKILSAPTPGQKPASPATTRPSEKLNTQEETLSASYLLPDGVSGVRECVWSALSSTIIPLLETNQRFTPQKCLPLWTHSSPPHPTPPHQYYTPSPILVPSKIKWNKGAGSHTLSAPAVPPSGPSATSLHRGILRSVNRPICTNCSKNRPRLKSALAAHQRPLCADRCGLLCAQVGSGNMSWKYSDDSWHWLIPKSLAVRWQVSSSFTSLCGFGPSPNPQQLPYLMIPKFVVFYPVRVLVDCRTREIFKPSNGYVVFFLST